jgi:uncharacterized protein (TIGR02246 family)
MSQQEMRVVSPILCVFIVIGCGLAQDNSPPAKLSPDQQAIRSSAEAFVAAFNKGDAKTVASLWTPEGEMSVDGEAVGVGREEIAAKYAEYFAANPDATIRVEIDTIRMLGPNMAVERAQ